MSVVPELFKHKSHAFPWQKPRLQSSLNPLPTIGILQQASKNTKTRSTMVWSLWSRSPQTPADSPGNNQLVHYGGNQQSIESSPAPVTFQRGIQLFHDCPDATVDICFVHGLTGNLYSTWTADGQSEAWPKTLLAPELKSARILTFGYDAYVLGETVASKNRLIDHATDLITDLTNKRARKKASTRALIFVAHSLGGLVCKRVLLQSRNNPNAHLKGIFECTKGIIFMGTPHTGSWMASWAKISAECIGMVKSTNTSLLKILETDDQLLEAIQIEFLSMIRDLRDNGRRIEVTCFFEEKPFRGAGLVVSKASATFPEYNVISIPANHKEMVKFAFSEDPGFQRVLGELTRWEEEIEVEIAEKIADQERRQQQQQQRQAQHEKRRSRRNVDYGQTSYHNHNAGGGKHINGSVYGNVY